MTLSKVTVVCDLADGAGNLLTRGTGYFNPSVQVTDSADHLLIAPGLAVPVAFRAGGPPSVTLIADDDSATAPAGWRWVFTPPPGLGLAATYTYDIAIANGATQYLSSLTPVASAVTTFPLNPMTTLGDIIYEDATPVPARLPGNTSTTRKFLRQLGDGTNSAAPAWDVIASGDLPAATTAARGAVTLDGTAADIAAVGSAASAGATGKAADAGHVHATAAWWVPADDGLLLAAFDPAVSSQGITPANGRLYLMRVTPRAGMTVSTLYASVDTAATGSSTGSFMGVYDASYNLLRGTADTGTSLGVTAAFGAALTSSLTLTAGTVYYLGFLQNMGTACKLRGISSVTQGPDVAAVTGAPLRALASASTSLTALPDPAVVSASGSGEDVIWLGAA